ncbi:MAG TPA: DUF1080 domain-containing protein [Humisphaera sp.]
MTRSTWKTRLAALAVAGTLLTGAATTRAADAPAAAPQAAPAAEPNTLSDKEKADGWKLLFDGKSAEHFRNYNKKDAPLNPKWVVADGALTLTGSGGGDIITKDQYESFEFTVDYRISKGGNSGLMFRVIEVEKKPPYDSGPEIQIQDNKDGHDPQLAGWLYQMYPPPKDEKTGKPIDATKPVGEWNTIRFTLKGNHGEIYMNGVKYSEWEIGSPDWNERLAKSKFAKWPNFAKNPKAHLCLQDHGGTVISFRNIKIRELPSK